jgi:hypothetical protein
MTCAIVRADAAHSGCLRGAFAFWGRGSAGPSSSRFGCATARCRRASDHVRLPLVCAPPLFRTTRCPSFFLLGQPEESRAPRKVQIPPERVVPPHRLPLAEVPRPRGSAAPTERCQRRYKLATLASIGSTLGSADAKMNRHVVDTRESRRRFFARRADTSESGARARRSARDRNPNVCAAVVVVPDVRGPTVRFGDHAHDRKPEARACAGPRSVGSREALERT